MGLRRRRWRWWWRRGWLGRGRAGREGRGFSFFAEGFEGFIKGSAEGGFVALEQGEVGAAGGTGEELREVPAVLDLGFVAKIEFRFDVGGEQSGFHADAALEAPLGDGDLLDEDPGEGVFRPEVFVEGGGKLSVGVFVLVGEADLAGGEAVLEGVLGGAGLALGRFGSGGFLGVASIGFGLFFGCHRGIPYAPSL